MRVQMPKHFTGHIGIGGMELKGSKGGQLDVPQHIAEQLIRHHDATPVTFTPDLQFVKPEEASPLPPAAPPAATAGATNAAPDAMTSAAAVTADNGASSPVLGDGSTGPQPPSPQDPAAAGASS